MTHVSLMFLSEWREFPSSPCLAKKSSLPTTSGSTCMSDYGPISTNSWVTILEKQRSNSLHSLTTLLYTNWTNTGASISREIPEPTEINKVRLITHRGIPRCFNTTKHVGILVLVLVLVERVLITFVDLLVLSINVLLKLGPEFYWGCKNSLRDVKHIAKASQCYAITYISCLVSRCK
jgi:hypothetical protein